MGIHLKAANLGRIWSTAADGPALPTYPVQALLPARSFAGLGAVADLGTEDRFLPCRCVRVVVGVSQSVARRIQQPEDFPTPVVVSQLAWEGGERTDVSIRRSPSGAWRCIEGDLD